MAAASPKVGEKVKHIYKQLYPWNSKFDLATYLCKSIFYSSDGVIALNKPFGVGLKNLADDEIQKLDKNKPRNVLHTHGVGSTYTFEDALPLIRKELNLPKLIVVKSAEKYHSGVTVLAENEAVANKIKKSIILAKARQNFRSTFYIISPYIPLKGSDGNEFKERVAISMQKNPMHNVAQPVIIREFSRNSVKRRDVDPVQVAFSIKSTSPYLSTLVQFKCNTTRRNMLRIYCADMLMPILGDHLYSCRVTTIGGVPTHLNPLHLKPGSVHQKLPPKIFLALELQKEGSAIIPLHVHLRNLTLVDFNGRKKDLNLTAPFTDLFKWTCDALKLTLPQDNDNVVK